MGRDRRNADRQSVRSRFGNRIGADVAAAAGPVLDDHSAERVLDPFGQQPGRHVDRSARGIRDDQADRSVLRQGGGEDQCRASGQRCEKKVSAVHSTIVLRPLACPPPKGVFAKSQRPAKIAPFA